MISINIEMYESKITKCNSDDAMQFCKCPHAAIAMLDSNKHLIHKLLLDIMQQHAVVAAVRSSYARRCTFVFGGICAIFNESLIYIITANARSNRFS